MIVIPQTPRKRCAEPMPSRMAELNLRQVTILALDMRYSQANFSAESSFHRASSAETMRNFKDGGLPHPWSVRDACPRVHEDSLKMGGATKSPDYSFRVGPRWDEIAAVFSRDAVLKRSFDRYAESNKKKRGTAEKVEEKPEVRKAGGVGFPAYCPPIPSRQILGGGAAGLSRSVRNRRPCSGPRRPWLSTRKHWRWHSAWEANSEEQTRAGWDCNPDGHPKRQHPAEVLRIA